MMDVRTLILLIPISLSLYFLSLLFKFLYKFVWNPIRIQNLLRSQGIKGPSYKFPYGSTTESNNMIKKAMSKSMELSHDTFPRVEPHTYKWRKIYGMNFVTWFGPKAQLVVTEPGLVKEILTNRDGAYLKTDVEGFVKKIFGYGLVTSQGEKWAKQRKVAKNAFHAESLKGMISAIISSVETMLERWVHQEGKEIELDAEFRVLTSELISKAAFGSSYLEGKNIYEMVVKLKFIGASNFQKIFPGIGKFSHAEIESEKLVHGIRESIINLVKEREEKVNSEELDGFIHNYLDVLIKANQEADENKKISIDDVVDEIKTVYIAGQGTTTSLLTWTTFLLALHTDWQEKARNEVFELFGQENPTSYDNGIIKLKIMSMIINESLRLYPPALAITRKVAKEVKLGGKLILPQNIELSIPTLALHHDQEIWGEDVHHFKPERFAEGLAKASNNNTSAFLPFGLGPRSCVGLNLATLETKIALSMILQRYSFSLSPTYVHSPALHPISRPQYGVQIMLQPLHA